MDTIYIEALQELDKYNEKLIRATSEIVEFLRSQKEDQALALFISAIDGFNWVLEVISHTYFILEKHDFNQDTKAINSALSEMTEALDNRDYVLLGDLLEYEMIPFLMAIRNSLRKIEKDDIKKTAGDV